MLVPTHNIGLLQEKPTVCLEDDKHVDKSVQRESSDVIRRPKTCLLAGLLTLSKELKVAFDN
jgi:hypothetical protein